MSNGNFKKPQNLDELCVYAANWRPYYAEGVSGFFIMGKEGNLVRFSPTQSDSDAARLRDQFSMVVCQNLSTGNWTAQLSDRRVERATFRDAVTTLLAIDLS